MNDRTFPYSEALASKKLMVPRRELRDVRDVHLAEGIDWEKNAVGSVMLSERGVRRLLERLKIKTLIDFAELKKNGATTGPEILIVVQIPPNPRVVLANASGDPNQDRITVDVGNNANFFCGDRLEVAKHLTQQGVRRLLSKPPSPYRPTPLNPFLRHPGAKTP